MCNFKIGEKVVCVDANIYLVNGEIYTIVGFSNCVCGVLCVLIGEIKKPNPNLPWTSFCKCGNSFESENAPKAAWRFRKLDHQFAEDVIAYITELETVNI